MRRIKFLSMFVLLILMLSVATGQVIGQEPSVENSSPPSKNADELWSLEEVTYYASLQIEDFSNDDVAGEFESWQNATVGAITLVRDATGDPVLYDVTVESDGRPVGLIQIWAKKLMGVPFHTVRNSTVWIDLRERVHEAHKIATPRLGSSKITKSEMVYVAYPQRAFALTFQQGDVIDQVLVDVTTERIVSPDEVVPFAAMLNPDQLRKSMEAWESLQKQLDDQAERQAVNTTVLDVDHQAERQAVNTTVLNVDLFAQVNACFCVPASAQMIYKYHTGSTLNQYNLANTFGTWYPNYCYTPYINIVPGWNALGFNAHINWSKASPFMIYAYISRGEPYMSVIRRADQSEHVRVVVGFWGSGQNTYTLINDPEPVQQGDQYWEHVSSSIEAYHIPVY